MADSREQDAVNKLVRSLSETRGGTRIYGEENAVAALRELKAILPRPQGTTPLRMKEHLQNGHMI